MDNLVEQIQQKIQALEKLQSEQQQTIGRRDAMKKQLADLGYPTLDEARTAVTKLKEESDGIATQMRDLATRMDEILAQARGR